MNTKDLSILFLILLLFSTPAQAFEEPDGFRNYKWGMRLDEISEVQKREGKKHLVFDDRIGDVTVSLWLRFFPVGMPVNRNSTLAAVTLSFKSSRYESLKITFIERYGKPTSVKRDIMTSRMGVRLENEILRWKGEKTSVQLRRLFSRIDEGWAKIGLNSHDVAQIENMKRKAKAAGKSF